MILHAGNNAFGLWAAEFGLPLAGLDAWLYFAALVVFLLGSYMLWCVRSPYPGLRP